METFGDASFSAKASGSKSITELSVRKRSRMSADHDEGKTKAPKVVNGTRNLGVAASHAVRDANIIDKNRSSNDCQKQQKIGKKHNRQTMFLDLDDVKQAVQSNLVTQRRPTSPTTKNDIQLDDMCVGEGNISVSETNGREGTVVVDSNFSSRSKRFRSGNYSNERKSAPHGQNQVQVSSSVPSQKPTSAINTQYQDTSIERLIREVTNVKLWNQSGTK